MGWTWLSTAACRPFESGRVKFYELRLKPGAIAILIRIKFSSGKRPLRENPSGDCTSSPQH